jgi:hypothetical protein
MKKRLVLCLVAVAFICFFATTTALSSSIKLAQQSTLEAILKKGELRDGFSILQPFSP